MKNKEAKTNLAQKDTGKTIAVVILFIFLLIFSFTVLYPLVWGLITSLKNRRDFSVSFGANLLGMPNLDESVAWNSRNEFFRLANYKTIFDNLEFNVSTTFYQGSEIIRKRETVNIVDLLVNTILYCVLGAGLKVIVTAICAFICAKYEFKFSMLVYLLVVINMTVPVVGTLPAELRLFRNLGVYDTWIMHVFQSASFDGMYFLVFFATYKGFPNSFIEAAEIDGASQLKVLVSIALPLTVKIMFTIFILQFISFWNNYTNPLLYLPTHPTLATGVLSLAYGSQGGLDDVTVKTAACMLLAVPIFVLFIIFHKRIMGNVSMGGLKE